MGTTCYPNHSAPSKYAVVEPILESIREACESVSLFTMDLASILSPQISVLYTWGFLVYFSWISVILSISNALEGDEVIRLIGVLLIVIGFALRLDTIATVLVAGIVTGLVAGLGIVEVLEIIGEAFVNTRYMSVFLVTLPVIGLLERYGLKERAAALIGGIRAVTAGRILSIYMVIRTLAAAFSLRLGGHVQFIRPVILPMAEGAAVGREGDLSEEKREKLKGLAAAVENYGNFFGQNIFVASGGVLLVVGTLSELGYSVDPLAVAKASIPVGIVATVLAVIQFLWFDRSLERAGNKLEKSSAEK